MGAPEQPPCLLAPTGQQPASGPANPRPYTLLLSACRVHKRGLNNRPLHHHEKEPQLLPFKFRCDRET